MIKKNLKKKICKSCKGALAIFLCILFTPFLSIAYSLVEFSRMQGAAETVGEIADMSALSTLSNYDEYLKNRFGLLALSQDSKFNLQNEYNDYFNNNVKLLGGAVDTSQTATNISGKLPLDYVGKNKNNKDELSVLKSQILDYSESTVALDIINKDLNIEDLIKKINEILEFKIFDKLFDCIGSLKEITSAVSNLFNMVTSMVEGWHNISESYKKITDKCNDMLKNIRELSQFIYNNYKDELFSDADKVAEKASESIIKSEEYKKKIKEIYEDKEELLKEVSNIKDTIKNVIDKVKTTSESTQSNIENIASNGISNIEKKAEEESKKKNNSNTNGNTNSNTNSNNSNTSASFSDILSSSPTAILSITKFTTGLFDKLSDKIKENLSKKIGEKTDEIIQKTQNKFDEKFGDYNPNDPNKSNDETLEASAEKFIKNGIIPIIKAATDNGNITENISDEKWDKEIKSVLFNESLSLLVKINNINMLDIAGIVKDSLWDCVKELWETLKSIFDWLLEIVNMFKNMLTINGIYDVELNAILSSSAIKELSKNNSEYQELFKGLQSFLSALGKIQKALEGKVSFEIFGTLTEFFDGLKCILEAVNLRVQNMADIVSDIANSIGSGLGGMANDFYEKLLIAGYATHNFPNRTMKGNSEYNNLVKEVKLKGAATTGYKYENIKNKKTNINTESLIGDITGIGPLLDIWNYSNGTKDGDDTFVGAELEYIDAGTSSEIINQIVSFMEVYMVRIIANIPAFALDEESVNIATELGSATFGIGAVVYYLVLVLGEPLIDTVFLVNSNSFDCSIFKIKCYLTPSGLENLVNDVIDIFKEKSGELKGAISKVQKAVKNQKTETKTKTNTEAKTETNTETKPETKPDTSAETSTKVKNWLGDFAKDYLKADYSTHMLLILMVCKSENDILKNIANMIQLEAASYYKSENGLGTGAGVGAGVATGGGFRESEYSLSKAYTTIHIETEVQHNTFLSNFQLNDKSIMKKKYVQDRGY